MKKYITMIFCFFLVLSGFSFSKSVNNLLVNNNLQNKLKPQVAYKVYLPAHKNTDGSFTSAKEFDILLLPKSEYLPNTIQVKTKKFYNINERKSKLPQILSSSIKIENIRAPFESFNYAPLKKYDNLGISRIMDITYSNNENPYDVCKELMKNPNIEYATPIFRRHTFDYTPNDPQLSKQWALDKIQASKAWDISKGDSTILIAIVDSGVDYNHEDLKDNIWINPNEIPDDGIDNDSNGYVDDYHGWDFIGNVSPSQAASGATNPDNDPRPGFWHGTHVAGCAAAVGDNNKGVAGPGYKCKILPVKCGVDQSNSRSIFRGYEGIMYAAMMGADIINCSWGGDGASPGEQEIISIATKMGSLIVVAAGNSRRDIDYGNSYPAGYDDVLCVGATRTNETPAWFSNYGRLVTVYAPGQSIYATMPNNKYANESGTSMACPIVAGICGQIKAIHPDWTPEQIAHQIRSTSENVVTTDPEKRSLYYGRVNAYRALSYNNKNLGTYEKIPGIAIKDVVTEDSLGILTDYETTSIKVVIKNYLSKARRLKVKIKALENYLYVSKDEVNIGTLDEMQTDTISLDLRLLKSTPWFQGKIDILLTFNSDSYTDYEIIQVPLKLDTKNEFQLRALFPETDLPGWYAAVSLSQNNLWLAGVRQNTGQGIVYQYGKPYNPNPISQKPLYCLFALDENTLFAGSGGNPTEIVKTTNAGMSWTSTNVSNITKFVNYIHFFDLKEGIFIGDPNGSDWGIGITKDGGKTWSWSKSAPKPLSGEAGLNGCAFGLDKFVWFGTNKGRIIYTKDRGQNWLVQTIKSNAFIRKIYFADTQKGYVLYSKSKWSSAISIASTFDGGAHWNVDKFDFSTYSVSPIALYSPSGTKMLLALCSGGEIYSSTDYGKSWSPILTYKYATSSVAAAFGESGDCRVWNAKSQITSLDFEYLPDNAIKKLTVTPEGTIDFGKINAGKNKTINVKVENTGNMNINIDSVKIESNGDIYYGEYRITFPISNQIKVGQSKTTRVKFSPMKEGNRNANLVIYSTADPNKMIIPIKGIGVNGIKAISFQKDTIVNFDSVEIGKSLEKKISFKNIGNVYFTVNSISLDGDKEFTFVSEPEQDFEIAPKSTKDITINFKPETEGLFTATLFVDSDAGDSTNPISVLKGFGIKPVSVDNSVNVVKQTMIISPNPSSGDINATINLPYKAKATLTLYNSIGKKISVLFDGWLNKNENIISLGTNNLSQGLYLIELRTSFDIITNKFIIEK